MSGYIDGKLYTEKIFYFPFLADLAAPGAVFDPNQTEYFGLIAFVPVIGHVLLIMQLNGLYQTVAGKLTEWENHRLEEEHQDAMIIKRSAPRPRTACRPLHCPASEPPPCVADLCICVRRQLPS